MADMVPLKGLWMGGMLGNGLNDKPAENEIKSFSIVYALRMFDIGRKSI